MPFTKGINVGEKRETSRPGARHEKGLGLAVTAKDVCRVFNKGERWKKKFLSGKTGKQKKG